MILSLILWTACLTSILVIYRQWLEGIWNVSPHRGVGPPRLAIYRPLTGSLAGRPVDTSLSNHPGHNNYAMVSGTCSVE